MNVMKSRKKFIQKRKNKSSISEANRDGLLNEIDKTQTHKGKDCNKFPLVKFIKHHNSASGCGWFSDLLNDVIGCNNTKKQNILLGLTYSLLIGSTKPTEALSTALNQEHLDGLVIPLLRSCLVPNDQQTEDLLELVKNSISHNTTSNLSKYLQQQKKDIENKGWLLRIICDRSSNGKSATQSETIVKSVLYNLLRGCCKSMKDSLPFACRTTGRNGIARIQEKSIDLFRFCLQETISSKNTSVAGMRTASPISQMAASTAVASPSSVGNKSFNFSSPTPKRQCSKSTPALLPDSRSAVSSENTSVGTHTTFPMSQTAASTAVSIAMDGTDALCIEPTGLVVGNTDEVLSPITTQNSGRTFSFASPSPGGNTSFDCSSPTPKRNCSKPTPAPFPNNVPDNQNDKFTTPFSLRQQCNFRSTEEDRTDDVCTDLFRSIEEEEYDNEIADLSTDSSRSDFGSK